jgi:hypothetical protein
MSDIMLNPVEEVHPFSMTNSTEGKRERMTNSAGTKEETKERMISQDTAVTTAIKGVSTEMSLTIIQDTINSR